ncbi:MAG: periplasmic heavy metal sensor [Calditrichia bacterium]
MVKIKIFIGILIFLMIINLAVLGSYLYHRWSLPERTFPFSHERSAAMFDHSLPRLDREQRHQLRRLQHRFHETVSPFLQQRRQYRRDMFELLRQDELDTAAVYEKLKELNLVDQDIERKAVELLMETRQFLSPEQLSFLYHFLSGFQEGAPPGRRYRGGSGRGPFRPEYR